MEEAKTKRTPSVSLLSANSAEGFYSLYEGAFDLREFDRIFVIAGGPGTGKSTLMQRLAAAGVEAGAVCEEILCSSDPVSLDGVILEAKGRRVGILDGTPPHPRTVTAPGFKEELFAFERFWDTAGLYAQRSVIEALNERKRTAYLSAYHYLSALGSLQKEEHLSRARYFDKEKAVRQIRHKTHLLKESGPHKKRFLRAFSTKGEFVLPFARTELDGILLISGKESSAEMYLSLFSKSLQEKGIAFTEYLSPLCPEFTEGIYLPENKTLLIKEGLYKGNVKSRRIVADRFFPDAVIKGKERDALSSGLLDLAITSLSSAGKAHAAIEEIYKARMDFDALQAESKHLCARVLSTLGL